VEAIAPGFKSRIIDSYQWTPVDIWRVNPAAVYNQGARG
jgi:hypothetical protein